MNIPLSWSDEITLKNGDVLETDRGRSLPLKILSQQQYNDLWASLPFDKRTPEASTVLKSNGYCSIVTDEFIACVGIGDMNGIPVTKLL